MCVVTVAADDDEDGDVVDNITTMPTLLYQS